MADDIQDFAAATGALIKDAREQPLVTHLSPGIDRVADQHATPIAPGIDDVPFLQPHIPAASVTEADVQRLELGIAGRSLVGHDHDDRYQLIGSGAAGSSLSPAGLKTVALALTTGNSRVESGLTERGLRIPLRYNAPLYRWRLHVRNWNPRLGEAKTGAVTVTGAWVANHTGSGAISSAVRVLDAVTLPADGSEYVSPWLSAPLGNDAERALLLGYTCGASTAPYSLIGGSWQTASAADAANPAASVTRADRTPLDIWIEAETPAGVPVIAGVGDSLTAGVGATLPVYESWVAQYARTLGGLPMIVAHSGDTMGGFLSNREKFTRWTGLAPADAVVWALGSNDLSSRTVAQMQTDFPTLLPLIENAVGPVRYAATVQPRNGWGADMEAKRAEWNAWLAARPQLRGILDFAAVVSTDGDTLIPAYDSGDGTHLSTAGYAAEAASITVPLSEKPVTTLEALAARLAVVEYDSGWRNVVGLLLNGWTATRFLVRRVGPVIQFRVNGLNGTAATSEEIIRLPAGFYPPSAAALTFGGRLSRASFGANFNNSGALTASTTLAAPNEYSESTAMVYAPTTLPSALPGDAP